MKKLLLLIVFAFAVSVQPFGLQTQTVDAVSAHTHNWSPVYKTVYHNAEYQTKTYWMCTPAFYYGDHPEYCPYGPNRLTPDKDPDGWWQRRTSYDLLCWHYGSLENIPDEYKIQWITKDTCTNYGISSSGWNNVPSYDGYYVATIDYWGNVTKFNPEYDVLVCIKGTAEKNAINAYKDQFGVSFSAACSDVGNCYMPMAQEKVKTKDAWTENVLDHYECTGCDDILNCSSSTPYKVDLPADDNTLAGESAAVTFSGKGGSSTINTDKSGCFIVPAELADGTYTVTASADSFVTRKYTVTVSKGNLSKDPEIQLNLIGDADRSGTVNTSDITAIKKHLKRTGPLTGYNLSCADANCDGNVNTEDITRIKRHLKKTAPLW